MRHRLSTTIAVLVSIAGTSVAGGEPPELAPTTPWNLRYDEHACRLVRAFGTGDDAVTAVFAKYGPSIRFEVILSGKGLDPKGTQLRYRFRPSSGYEFEQSPLFGTEIEGKTGWQFASSLLPASVLKAVDPSFNPEHYRAADAARRAQVDSFELSRGTRRTFTLLTGKLDKPFAAMDACLDDLVASWGFDPAKLRTLTAWPKPKSNPGSWVTAQDFPYAMIHQGKSGIVQFRLDVDSNGKPQKCAVQAAFTDPTFEKATCDSLLKRARFEPAKDASGVNVPAYWINSVKWVS